MSNKIIVKDHKYYFKIRGLGGVKGDKGDTGPAGPQGPQGPYVNVQAGNTTTLPAGSSAQVTVNNTGNTSVLNFGIPQGAKGDKGDAGTPGAQGPRGFAATVNVGQTTTGEPGTDASVINAGNEHDAVLKFTIPKGEKGDTGETGPQGPTGGVKSTVVAELPETGQDDTYYLLNRSAEEHTTTTTDGYTQITNTENAGDLTLDKLNGNAEQKTLSGKNICSNATVAGNTSIRFYFDKTNSTNIVLSAITNATTDRASVYLVVDSTEIARIGAFSGGANQRGSAILTLTQTQIDAIQAGASSWLNLYVGGGDFASVSEAQIESGSSMTAYEPYVGGIPSPNPDFPQEIKTVTGAQTVKITGKNLFAGGNANYVGGQAWNGYGNSTYTLVDGAYTMPDRYGAIAFEYDNLTAGQQYTISFDVSASAQTDVRVGINRYTNAPVVGDQYQFTAKTQTQRINWTFTATEQNRIAFNSGITAGTSVTFSNIMLNYGSTAEPYEPYQSKSQEINLGKNLWNPDNAQSFVTAVNNANQAKLATYDGRNCLYWTAGAGYGSYPTKNFTLDIKFKENTQYAVSYDTIKTTIATRTVAIYYTDGTYTRAEDLPSTDTWTHQTIISDANKTIAYVAPWYSSGESYLDINTLQIEQGAQATPYSAYKTPIELAKIGTYQDYIWNDDGTWKIHKEIGKVVLDGTEAWGAIWGNTAGLWTSNVSIGAEVVQGNDVGISDHFTYKWSYNSNTPCFYVYNQSGQGRIMVIQSFTSDLDTYKAWLSTHNTTVYYALATPTDTEITDADLIGQLDALAPASLYEGVNNIMLIPSAGPQGELALSYVLYDKYNQHQVYIWSSDDNTWQIILP